MGLFRFLFGKKKKKAEKSNVSNQQVKENAVKEPIKTVTEEKPKEVKAEVQVKTQTEVKAEPKDVKAEPEVKTVPKTEKPEVKTAAKEVEEKKEEPKQKENKEETAVKKTTPKKPKITTELDEEEIESVAKDAESVHESANTRSGKFEIKKSKDGRFVFNLYASNHVIVATSQIYSSSQSAMNGIKSVMANAEKAGVEDTTVKEPVSLPYPKWEIYLDKGNQYRFRLNAPNGSCICHSQGYTTKNNCKKGIESIIKFSKDAEIEKAYLKKE